MKKPVYYKTPLKTRRDIAGWIFASTSQRCYYRERHPFCFNVKCYDVDFDFENLLRVHRKEHGGKDGKGSLYTHDEDWLAACRAKHAEIGMETLWEWSQESACRHFVSDNVRDQGRPGSDTFRILWDGTELDVRYAFVGRSGGWLSIIYFEGHDFLHRTGGCPGGSKRLYERLIGSDADPDYDTGMEPWSYAELRQLYQLVVMLKHDLRPEAVKDELEHGAAWDLFENACADVPRPDTLQPYLIQELAPADV